MDALLSLAEVPVEYADRCNKLVEFGILSCISSGGEKYIARSQYDQLVSIGALNNGTRYNYQLVPTESQVEISLTDAVSISNPINFSFQKKNLGCELLIQLLPECFDLRIKSAIELSRIIEINSSRKVITGNNGVAEQVAGQLRRVNYLRRLKSSGFSRLSHYMGSKQNLAPFINEILLLHAPKNVTVLDIMCGSGATAGAFSSTWKTIASDAQNFSCFLAKVQGGGYTLKRASDSLQRLLPLAQQHCSELALLYADDLLKEDRVIGSELDLNNVNDYLCWAQEFRVRSISNVGIDNPSPSIKHCRLDPKFRPYQLFINYYANLFFGVRQSIEIDSLRYAIDQISDQVDREWALGILVSAVSFCADTYAGHFAQPRVKHKNNSDMVEQLRKTLFKRSLSVISEFSTRFFRLAEESEFLENSINIAPGPWQCTVQHVKDNYSSDQVVVYLDPPYTRQEYSRYYHVLETLVNYNYPFVEKMALVPVKGGSNRFSSEFFTRSADAASANISSIINVCLKLGWSVLWSYSNVGVANIAKIVRHVEQNCGAFHMYSANYVHSGQGKNSRSNGRRDVFEYFFYFKPNKK